MKKMLRGSLRRIPTVNNYEQLDSLPSLFEQEELEQVSLIENKNIRVVK